MKVIERTAMRIVIEQRAHPFAPATAAVAVIGAAAALVQLLRTDEPLYLIGLTVAVALLLVAVWLSHGVRTTLDAAENVAMWERTGVLRARRQAPLSDVGSVVLLPQSDDALNAAFNPVLTVRGKRWPLALSCVTDPEPTRAAISEVLDLGKGRRGYSEPNSVREAVYKPASTPVTTTPATAPSTASAKAPARPSSAPFRPLVEHDASASPH